MGAFYREARPLGYDGGMNEPLAIFASWGSGFTQIDFGICVFLFGVPVLIAVVWVGSMIWRRRFGMGELFLFIAYLGLLFAYVSHILHQGTP
jgi:hypothetical protein